MSFEGTLRSRDIGDGLCESIRRADEGRMTESIETLLFDFGGTLDADGVAWKERFYAIYQAEGVVMNADAFASAFYLADEPLVGGLAPSTGLAGTVEALVANLEVELARRGFGIDRVGAASGNRGRRVASSFLLDAKTTFARNRPVLETLRGRYRLGIVSNFYGNLEAVCHSAGLTSLFAVLVDSYCIGAEKPDPAIFRAALESLGALPETTLFIGDSLPRDREGARRAGLGFIWIAPRETQATEALASAQPPARANVTALPDLLKILP